MASELMDLEQLAAWLRVSKAQAYRISKDFPCLVLSDRVRRFEKEEVLDWLKQKRAIKQAHQGDSNGLHPRKLKAV